MNSERSIAVRVPSTLLLSIRSMMDPICSRSRVHNHGGRNWAASNAGPGTSSHFSLPKQEKQVHMQEPQESDP